MKGKVDPQLDVNSEWKDPEEILSNLFNMLAMLQTIIFHTPNQFHFKSIQNVNFQMKPFRFVACKNWMCAVYLPS